MKSVVSEKGQVTLPKALRTRLGLKAGTIVDFEVIEGRLVGTKRDEQDPLAKWRGRGKLPQGMATTDEYLAWIRP